LNITFQAIEIFVFLLPGFVTLFLVSHLVSTPQTTEFDKIISALFYSFLTYTIYSLLTDLKPVYATITPSGSIQQFNFNLNGKAFAILLVISSFLGLLASLSYTYDLHMKLFRFIKITKRTSRNTVWTDVFSDKKSYIIANLSDNQRAIGWPEYYSDTSGQEYIFLTQASWIDENNNTIPIQGPGLLITLGSKIESIEFVNGVEEE
jgi:hypothetical protein